MNDLEVIIEMRKTLVAINESLTPYSTKIEYQRYVDSLKHYKKILASNTSRAINEIDNSILKSYRIIDSFTTTDVKNIKTQIENGGQ